MHEMPSVLSDIFSRRDCTYNLRSNRDIEIPQIQTTSYGELSLRYFGPKLWDIVPYCMKEAASLSDFKKQIRTWKPQHCPCRCCKEYIANIGFINTT